MMIYTQSWTVFCIGSCIGLLHWLALLLAPNHYTFRYQLLSQVYKSLTYLTFEDLQKLPKLPPFKLLIYLVITQPNNRALAKPC